MAKYDVECPSCGTGYTVQLCGPGRDREWKLANWDWTCDGCREKRCQEENAKAAAQNAASGLPALTGSDKQIAWAETIRKQKLTTLEELIESRALTGRIDKDRFSAAVENLKKKASASWWIEHRDEHIDRLMKAEYDATEKPLPAEDRKIAEEAKVDATIEATVRPEKPITETVAEIRALEKSVEVHFPEKREDFRQIVRFKLGYGWNGTCWRRNLKPTNGTAHDRAAELGHRLLTAGYPIRLFDDTIRVHAVTGTFEAESKRWIRRRIEGQYKDWLAISWPKSEDFYQAAKRIRGSRYDKPHIVVPPEQFEEVLDFAQMFSFSISEGADEVIEAARRVRASALTASVAPCAKKKLPVPGEKPEPIAVPEGVDVADEFREEN
jgi:hypothetical protein